MADWSSSNRIQPSEFENDPRFLKLCRLLSHEKVSEEASPNMQRAFISRNVSSDLDMILNVAADDEAARLISALQLPQMVKVLTALSVKKRRSPSLLRSLAYNISSHAQQLNLKECADVLYAMTILSFHDLVLMTRVSIDTQQAIGNNTKAAPVGSLITSLGHLKFRDTGKC